MKSLDNNLSSLHGGGHHGRSISLFVKSPRINSKPPIEQKPLSISKEFDSLIKENKAQTRREVDRSEWMNRISEIHPEIKAFRETVNPITRAATFGRLYLPQNRYVDHDALLALISQHLRTLGLSSTQDALNQEWGSDFNIPPHKLYSQLSLLVQRGIYRAEKFWELSIPSVHAQSTLKLTQAALDDAISTTIGASTSISEDKNPIEEEKPYDPEFYKEVEENDKSEAGARKEPAEASLNQIIFYVTDPDITNTSEILNALILTIQSYTTSKVFFTKISNRIRMAMHTFDESQRYFNEKQAELTDVTRKFKQEEDNLEEDEKKELLALLEEGKKNLNAEKKKVSFAERSVRLSIRLFKEWMKTVINELEPQTLEAAKQFVKCELMANYSNYVANMFEKKQDPLRLQLLMNATPVDIGSCTNLWTGDFELFDLPVKELARQITYWSYARYYAIKRTELLDCAWEKPRLKYRAPNVIALTQHYNKISLWVEHAIVFEMNYKRRMEKFHYLIQLMQELYKMNNFLDTAGIVGGFDSNAIYRLKFHYSQLTQQERDFVEEMKVVCSPDKGFANLRKKQDDALLSNKPALPYIGILLSDLFKYDDAVALFVNGLINVRKMKGLNNYITKIEQFKRSMYCFLAIDQVQDKISQLEIYDEELLYIMSQEIENDGASSLADIKDEAQK